MRKIRSLRYSNAYPELLSNCPACYRNFKISRSHTPVKGVDLPHYINHLERDHNCLRIREADLENTWIQSLPKSFQENISQKTSEEFSSYNEWDPPNFIKKILYFSLAAQMSLYFYSFI